jgi:hypothetical protein
VDAVMVRFFATGFALMFGGWFSVVGTAQVPATISYGSLAPVTSSTIQTENAAVYPTHYSPIYVAQNTSPAPITLPGMSSVAPAAPPSIALPPFDPYAVSSQSSWLDSIFPVGSGMSELGQTASSNVYSGNFDRFFPETYEAMRRFRDATSFEYTHLPRGGSKNRALGMDQIDIRMQLAFPCRFIPNHGRTGYFYVAPAGSLVWWNGPTSPNMSPSGFGAFLDFGVQPKFNDTFSLNAWGRLGVFSDFENVTSDAFRYQGRLEGVGTLSPEMQLHVGVIYYGRARVKMLPTIGVVWTPDEDWVLKLVFPNPKVSRRLWRGPQTDWWGYVHMDYAGGSWDIKPMGGLTDYNDLRFGLGIEFAAPNQFGGYFEFGGSFARELYSGGHSWDAPTVLYLKTGVIF